MVICTDSENSPECLGCSEHGRRTLLSRAQGWSGWSPAGAGREGVYPGSAEWGWGRQRCWQQRGLSLLGPQGPWLLPPCCSACSPPSTPRSALRPLGGERVRKPHPFKGTGDTEGHHHCSGPSSQTWITWSRPAAALAGRCRLYSQPPGTQLRKTGAASETEGGEGMWEVTGSLHHRWHVAGLSLAPRGV